MNIAISAVIHLVLRFLVSSLLLLASVESWATQCETLLAPKLRVGLAQLNTTVGDFSYNIGHMIRFVDRAVDENVDLLVFPEMIVSSYPPRDWLDRPSFVEEQDRAVRYLQNYISKKYGPTKHPIPRIIFGAITENNSPNGRPYHNSAVGLDNDPEFPRTDYVQHKRLLPNYDVFDEMRHFEPGSTNEIWSTPWGNLACTVCEDIWTHQQMGGKSLYQAKDPLRKLARKAEELALIVNVSASPYEEGKFFQRMEALSRFTERMKTPLIYVNHVGAQDSLLFDGRSMIVSKTGAVLFEMPAFQEGLGIVDLNLAESHELQKAKTLLWQNGGWSDSKTTPPITSAHSEMDLLKEALVTGIRDYFAKTGYARAVIGISGGIDSAVVSTLAVEALGAENVIGISMPSPYSSIGSRTDAQKLAQALGIRLLELPITNPMETITSELTASFTSLEHGAGFSASLDDTTEDNIQARLRMILLTAMANKYDALVLGTSNKSELSVGQTTAWGDMAGALAPIGDLFKTKVYALASYLNHIQPRIPADVLTKPASAELAPGQTDEGKFGPFAILDSVLELHLEHGKSDHEIETLLEEKLKEYHRDPNYVARTTAIVRANEYKRNLAPIVLKVSPKAFGIGRRYPIASYLKAADHAELENPNSNSISQRMLERRAQYRKRHREP